MNAALRTSVRARKESARRVELDEALLEYSDALALPFTPSDSFETASVRAVIERIGWRHLVRSLRQPMSWSRLATRLAAPRTG